MSQTATRVLGIASLDLRRRLVVADDSNQRAGRAVQPQGLRRDDERHRHRCLTTRATFYAYFPSRSELMRALIDEKLNEGLQRIRSAHRGSTADDLVAAVRDGRREAIHRWLTEKADRWPSIHSIIRIGHDAAAVDPELRDLVKLWLAEATGDTEEGLGQADRFQRTNAASGASSPCHSSTPGHSTGVRRTGSSAASRCSTS